MYCINEGLTAPRMAAATVGPVAGPKRLLRAPTMDHQALLMPSNKNTENARCSCPAPRCASLFAAVAHRLVSGIDQNKLLVVKGHGRSGG
jgi:hypothetical protein